MKLNKKLLYVAIPLIIIIGAGTYYYMSHKDGAKSASSGQYDPNYFNPSENVPKSNDNSSSGGITSPKSSDSNKGAGPSTDVSTAVTPKKPVGIFVSNHRPNLSGHPAPNKESSTCSTTAGIMCEIHFTNGSITKKLSAKKTNSYGNTTWNWTLQQVGLSKGSWKVQVIATNGDKTATTNDAQDLVVTP